MSGPTVIISLGLVAVTSFALTSCDYASQLPANYPCRGDSECASGTCHHSVCASEDRRGNGEACADNGDCLSFRCLNGACAAGTWAGGAACLNHKECASGACVDGLCTKASGLDGGTQPRCGDGKKNGKEPCDGKDLAAKTCQTQGFTGGELACTNCALDTRGCYRVFTPKGVVISSGKEAKGQPTVAFGGGNYLVAWADERSGTRDIYASRVDRAGKVLDPTGIRVSTGGGSQDEPTVASSGINFLVAWTDNKSGSDTIRGARFSLSGAILDASGFEIASAKKSQHQPTVAYHDKAYMVAWSDDRDEASGDIYAVRVNLSGTLLDPNSRAISTGLGGQRRPALVYGGANYLFVWDDTRTGKQTIYAARVNGLGTVQDPSGLAVTSSNKDQEAPVIATNGTAYMVAWTDKRGPSLDIYAARVSLSGKMLDASGFAVTKAAGDQLAPALAAGKDGNYLLAWTDYRHGVEAAIYGARVAADSTVMELDGARISLGSGAHTEPAVATDDKGGFLVVWAGKVKGADATISCSRFQP